MKIKSLLCIILALVTAVSMFACGGGGTTGGQASEEPEESSAPEESAAPAALSINGNDVSTYRIIYSAGNEAAYYSEAAYALCNFIYETFGVEIEVFPDNENLRQESNEILIGFCNGRDDVEEKFDEYYFEDYDYGEFIIAVDGADVMLGADYSNGAYFAVEKFIELALSGDGEVGNMEITGEKEVIKVACVGDSITQGINSADLKKTYPVYLRGFLGPDYYVANYGLSGYSICETDAYCYGKSDVYKKSLAFEPDVVIFALGTNDCNPGANQGKEWEGTDREEIFIKSTKNLLDSYLALDTEPQIFVCIPCSLFKVGSDVWNAVEWAARNEKYSVPLITSIAAEYGFPTVDLWTWSLDHPEIFTDGLHPKDETYKPFAQAIYEGIKDLIVKP